MSTNEQSMTASAEDVVRIAARAHEPDRYLAALLSPRAVRADLVALAAFAGEVGRVPLMVSEPTMGRIRLQWWRERLSDGSSGGHPVAAAIIEARQRHDLPLGQFDALIEAHEDSLDDHPFADEPALFAYLDRIDGSLFDMAARICRIPAPGPFVTDCGRAYGMARIGIETPAAHSHGRLLLPSAGIDAQRAVPAQQLDGLIRAACNAARRHLENCSTHLRAQSRAERSPFLPVALVEPYLHALEQAQLCGRTVAGVQPLTRTWRLLRCRWTGNL